MKTRLISSGVGVVIVVFMFFMHNTIVLPLLLSAVTCIILFELARVVGGQRFGLAMTGIMLYGAAMPILEYDKYLTRHCQDMYLIPLILKLESYYIIPSLFDDKILANKYVFPQNHVANMTSKRHCNSC